MSNLLTVIGGDSEIGLAVSERLRAEGHEVVTTTRRRNLAAADRPLLDLSVSPRDWMPPKGTKAACICASVTRLGDCANDPKGSALINVTRTLELSQNMLARGIAVLFLSSDKVFDGTRAKMSATASQCPVSVYGQQKTAVERALRAAMRSGLPAAVLRLGKVISASTPLLRQWASDILAGLPVRACPDIMMAPTPLSMAASAIARLLSDPVPGFFQLTGPRDISYADSAARLIQTLNGDPSLLLEVNSEILGLPSGSAVAHTTLDSSRLRDRFGIVVPDPYDLIDDWTRHYSERLGTGHFMNKPTLDEACGTRSSNLSK